MVKLMEYSSGKYRVWNAPKDRIVVRIFIKIKLAYSARKNRVNGLASYLMLNLETNSDYPSAKLNGVGLLSARVEINNIIARGHVGRISYRCSCVVISLDRVKEPFINSSDRRIMVSVTS